MPTNRAATLTRTAALTFAALSAAALALASPAARAQLSQPPTVTISVLSLFHPRTLILTPTHPTAALFNGFPRTLSAPLTLTLADTLTLPTQTTFTLTVPGKLTRTYTAALRITSHVGTPGDGTLTAILTLPTELAVASIVAAESPPNAPFEALKAQAIVSRSYLLANHSHAAFDACDTTHCQFLRSPPPPNSLAARATAATRAQVLTWRPTPTSPPHIIAAMYARSCGGHTRPHPTPASSSDPAAYPYFRVACAFCLAHPHASSASQTYSRGHGIGLCQLGAAALAAQGQNATEILKHFFPNTTIPTPPSTP